MRLWSGRSLPTGRGCAGWARSRDGTFCVGAAVSSLDGRQEGFSSAWVRARRCDGVRARRSQRGGAGGFRERLAAGSRIRDAAPPASAGKCARAVPARTGAHAGRSALSEEAAAGLASTVEHPAWDAATGSVGTAHRVSRSRRPQPPYDLRLRGAMGARRGARLAAAPVAQSPMLPPALRDLHANCRSAACDDGRPARRARGTPRHLPASSRQPSAMRLGGPLGLLV
jgi:hypothetical protein